MAKDTQDHEMWGQVVNTSNELMARRGSPISPSVSETTWADQGVEYTLRRVTTTARPVKPRGHIMDTYSLTSFKTSGPIDGKMVMYTAPDAYARAWEREISIGLEDDEPPEVWALGALTLAMHQLEQ